MANLFLIACVVAERCPPIPIVENAQPSTLHTNHGTLVEFTCEEGYHLMLGNQSTGVQHSECLQTGAWSTEPQYCYSESICTGLALTNRISERSAKHQLHNSAFHCKLKFIFGSSLSNFLFKYSTCMFYLVVFRKSKILKKIQVW